MRSLAPYLVLVYVASPVRAQTARFPWHAGSAPPRVAGLRLHDSRARIDSVLGPPGQSASMGAGAVKLSYPARGISLIYTAVDSLAVIDLRTRAAGAIGGVRVGDTRSAVVTRWGEPTEVSRANLLWEVAHQWAIVARLDSAGTRVAVLTLGRIVDR